MLTVDATEHVVKHKLACQLQKLGLLKAYSNKFKHAGLGSCFRGRHQIDDIWYTHKIVLPSVST